MKSAARECGPPPGDDYPNERRPRATADAVSEVARGQAPKIDVASGNIGAPTAPPRVRRPSMAVPVRFASPERMAAEKEPEAPDQRRIVIPHHVDSPDAKDIAKTRAVDDRAGHRRR